MARKGNIGSKFKTQTVVKRPKGPKPEFPLNTTTSNAKGDIQAKVFFAGCLLAISLLFILGVTWAGQGLRTALSHSPCDWLYAGMMIVCMAMMFLLLRGLIWMCFFVTIMFASKVKAWKSQESFSRLVLKLKAIFPGGALTAALTLAQNLLGQNKIDEAIKMAEEQWQSASAAKSRDQNLGFLCATVGLAHQLRGQLRESITWNERAIDSLKSVLDQMLQPKGLMAKMVAAQGPKVVGPLRTHLAVVYLHNANAYFSLMNQRTAKENYKKAVDLANQAPDSPERKEVLQAAREQLTRLKHV